MCVSVSKRGRRGQLPKSVVITTFPLRIYGTHLSDGTRTHPSLKVSVNGGGKYGGVKLESLSSGRYNRRVFLPPLQSPVKRSNRKGHEISTQLRTEEPSDAMAACGRRTRPKLLFFLFGATLLGCLIFLKHNSGESPAANRRQTPVEERDLLRDEDLKKPVYEKPPLDLNALGELGRAVKLNLNKEEAKKQELSISKHQINVYVSDKVSLHRRLPERWNPL